MTFEHYCRLKDLSLELDSKCHFISPMEKHSLQKTMQAIRNQTAPFNEHFQEKWAQNRIANIA